MSKRNKIFLFSSLFVLGLTVFLVYWFAYRKNGGDPNPPQPPVLDNFSGCKNTIPGNWTNNMTKLDDCKTSCNANKLSVQDLENAVYSLVWKVSGADIYDDILGPNKYFINWGGYTKPYGKFNCINEPTGSACVYVDVNDAKKFDLLSKSDGKIQIRAKMIPHEQQVAPHTQPFVSVRLHSVPSFTYGIFVYHITKIPDPASYWSAAWLTAPFACVAPHVGAENKFGGWPYCGEIDVMEYIGGNTNSISSLHIPCRHMDDPVEVSRDQKVPFDQPGYFVLEWTPKFVKFYYLTEDEGKPFFVGQTKLKIQDLQPYNKTSGKRCDNSTGNTPANGGWNNNTLPTIGGCDVNTLVTKDLSTPFEHFDGDPATDKTWTRYAGVPPCDLTKSAQTEYSGDDLKAWLQQKKEAMFYPLGKHACEAGGMIFVLNIAINGKCNNPCTRGKQYYPNVFKESCPCQQQGDGCCCNTAEQKCSGYDGWGCPPTCQDFGPVGNDGFVSTGVMEISDVQVFQV
jgi:hypothetical protein